MKKEHEEKLKTELIGIYKKHLGNALHNIMRKAGQDVKNDIVNILETDDKEVLRDSRIYIDDITDILFSDLKIDLEKFLKEY